jgi:hypothetical protein
MPLPEIGENGMTKQFKVIVEKHPDGYVAYHLASKALLSVKVTPMRRR